MYSITCAYRKLVCMYKEIYIYIVVPTVALDHSQIWRLIWTVAKRTSQWSINVMGSGYLYLISWILGYPV